MTFEKSQKLIMKRPKKLADQVVDFIIKEIESGSFRPGDVLPSEAELTDIFNVSRAVIREAMAILKRDGIVETRQGGRTRIAKTSEFQPFRLLLDSEQENIDMGYLYELRIALEGEAAVLASKRATPEQIAEIESKLKELDKAMKEGTDGTNENVEFHKALIMASSNPYMIRFINWLNNRIRDQIQADRNLTPEKGLPPDVQQEHIDIYRAIKSGNPIEARAIVVKHFNNAAKRTGIKINGAADCGDEMVDSQNENNGI